MVTHEDDISRYVHRIVRLRDGMVESDKENKKSLVPNSLNYVIENLYKNWR